MPVILSTTIFLDNPSKDSYLIDLENTVDQNIMLAVGNLFNGQTVSVVIAQGTTRLGTIQYDSSIVFTGSVPELPAVYGAIQRIAGMVVNGQLIVDTTDLSTVVAKSGDTMTGPLVLSADPTGALQAATKQYVDASVPSLAGLVSKTGDTMSGALTVYPYIIGKEAAGTTVGATGILRLGATAQVGMSLKSNDSSFAYLDFVDNSNQRTNITYTFGTTLLEFGKYLNEVASPAALSFNFTTGSTITKQTSFTNNQEYVTKAYVDSSVPTLSNVVSKSGDTMTGLLILSGDPTVALGAATKQYVDNTSVSVAGDTMTGTLTLTGSAGITMSGDFTASSGATSVVIHSNGTAMTLTNTGLNIVSGVLNTNSNINVGNARLTLDDGATDFIILDGPTGNMATTKGTVTVSRNPATDFEVATKQYVDTAVTSASTVTHYVHLQTTSSTSWSVAHNLNTTNLIFNVYINPIGNPTTGWQPIFPADVSFVDLNNIIVSFTANQVGKVVIIAVP